jgi:hypothetical protein
MDVEIAGYEFEGLFELSNDVIRECIDDRSGVYAVVCLTQQRSRPCWLLVDAGESKSVRTRLLRHNRKSCWLDMCDGELGIGIHYTPYARKRGRMQVERAVRECLQPCCGER